VRVRKVRSCSGVLFAVFENGCESRRSCASCDQTTAKMPDIAIAPCGAPTTALTIRVFLHGQDRVGAAQAAIRRPRKCRLSRSRLAALLQQELWCGICV